MIRELPRQPASSGCLTLFRPTREMVRLRTLELASIAGRQAHQIHQNDYERAKRELTGESDLERQEAALGDSW